MAIEVSPCVGLVRLRTTDAETNTVITTVPLDLIEDTIEVIVMSHTNVTTRDMTPTTALRDLQIVREEEIGMEIAGM